MIGKIVKGTSFSGCVNYVLKEDKSRQLKAVGVYGSLLIVDNVSRNVSTAGIPIGILTAFVGAPFFLWLITGRSERL